MKNHSPLRILIIEDHPDLAENIGDYLAAKGHIPDFAYNGIGGLHLALTEPFDAIILDVMLPGMDGLTLCRNLREKADKHTPILMLTARDTLPDKLAGFDAGTDDYLVKPFALEELEARLLALVKRHGPKTPNRLQVADLEVDLLTMSVKRAGRSIELNRACLKLLIKLMKAFPAVVSRPELEQELWGDLPPDSDALRSHLYTLRRKIDKPFSKPLLQTVHGMGYKLGSTDDLSP